MKERGRVVPKASVNCFLTKKFQPCGIRLANAVIAQNVPLLSLCSSKAKHYEMHLHTFIKWRLQAQVNFENSFSFFFNF